MVSGRLDWSGVRWDSCRYTVDMNSHDRPSFHDPLLAKIPGHISLETQLISKHLPQIIALTVVMDFLLQEYSLDVWLVTHVYKSQLAIRICQWPWSTSADDQFVEGRPPRIHPVSEWSNHGHVAASLWSSPPLVFPRAPVACDCTAWCSLCCSMLGQHSCMIVYYHDDLL